MKYILFLEVFIGFVSILGLLFIHNYNIINMLTDIWTIAFWLLFFNLYFIISIITNITIKLFKQKTYLNSILSYFGFYFISLLSYFLWFTTSGFSTTIFIPGLITILSLFLFNIYNIYYFLTTY